MLSTPHDFTSLNRADMETDTVGPCGLPKINRGPSRTQNLLIGHATFLSPAAASQSNHCPQVGSQRKMPPIKGILLLEMVGAGDTSEPKS